MKYIDLFAGVGGFHYGIDMCVEKRLRQEQSVHEPQGNGKHNREDRLNSTNTGFTCVYSNEWDKYANSVYRKHFGECDSRDIREVKSFPDFDLLCGGFPCQSFSIAGKRGGFSDIRGTLFFEIARIVKQKQPRLLLLENVKGLLSHDQGKTFAIIISTLDELGYDIQWQVLNSKNFGVPQNRERVFIVGHLRGTSRPQVFPLRQDGNPLTKKNGHQTSQSSISGTLTATDAKMHLDGTYINQINQPKHSNDRVYGDDGIAPTLNTMQGGRRQPKIAIPVLTPDRAEKRQNGRRMKTNGEPSFTLTGQDIHGVFTGTKIRRLTPVECERLQGFPDNWTEFGADGEKISDTQRYKMCGNAVTVNVVTEIVAELAGRTE